MKSSDYERQQTQQNEGVRYAAYQDTTGKWTIGYGHTKGVTSGMTCTPDEALAMFNTDADAVDHELSAVLEKNKITVNQNQFDALFDWCFQFGTYRLTHSDNDGKPTTLFKCLKAGDEQGAADQFLRWCYDKVNGLVVRRESIYERRQRNRKLFLTPVYKPDV